LSVVREIAQTVAIVSAVTGGVLAGTGALLWQFWAEPRVGAVVDSAVKRLEQRLVYVASLAAMGDTLQLRQVAESGAAIGPQLEP